MIEQKTKKLLNKKNTSPRIHKAKSLFKIDFTLLMLYVEIINSSFDYLKYECNRLATIGRYSATPPEKQLSINIEAYSYANLLVHSPKYLQLFCDVQYFIFCASTFLRVKKTNKLILRLCSNNSFITIVLLNISINFLYTKLSVFHKRHINLFFYNIFLKIYLIKKYINIIIYLILFHVMFYL